MGFQNVLCSLINCIQDAPELEALTTTCLFQARGPSVRSSTTAPIKLIGNTPAMLNSSDATETIDTVNVTGANPLQNIILGALRKS